MEEKTLPPIKFEVSEPLTITAKSIGELQEKINKEIKTKDALLIYGAVTTNLIITAKSIEELQEKINKEIKTKKDLIVYGAIITNLTISEMPLNSLEKRVGFLRLNIPQTCLKLKI